MFRALFLSTLVFTVSLGCSAADWPQFLGPDRNGISAEKGLARSWSEKGPKQLWQTEVGPGFGGAAIRDGKVYLLDRQDDLYDVFRVFDLNTGKELWSLKNEMPGRISFNGSRCVPTVGEKTAFAVGPLGQLYAIDLKTQKMAWTVTLKETLQVDPPQFGFSQSPLKYKDLVIIAAMSPKGFMSAFNQKTGELVWNARALESSSYSSPKLVTIDGVPQIIHVNPKGVFSINPANGKTLWHYEKQKGSIPDPTLVKDNMLFVTAGYGVGSSLTKISRGADGWQFEEVFKIEKRGSQVHHALIYNNHLYANFNTNENLKPYQPEGLVCVNLQGETMWQTKDTPAFNRGSLILADGLILALGGEDGVLRLIEPNQKAYKELASVRVFDNLKRRDNQIWAPMALSNGKLVLRSQLEMKCLDLTKGS